MMLIRKKFLKIQERLGMNLGVMTGVSSKPVIKTVDDAIYVLNELYKVGFRALVLPPEMFANIKNTTDLYKEYYGDLLRIKNIAKKFNIELAIRQSRMPESPEEALRLYSTIASVMDCRIFIIQPNFYKGVPRSQAITLMVHKLSELMSELRVSLKIGIETTGFPNELGSVEDVIEICKRTRNTEPVINWAAVHARGTGCLKNSDDYQKVMEKIKQGLGMSALKSSYFLFAGARYGPSGIKEYISFSSSDMKLDQLIKSIMSYGIKGSMVFIDPSREKGVVDMLEEIADMVR